MIAHRPRRCRLILVLSACACVAVAVSASSAHAAPYTVWACADGSGKRQPAADWNAVRVSDQIARLSSSCGDSAAEPTAALKASATSNQTNDPVSAGVGWRVDAAPGTHITGLDLWWQATIGRTYTRERGRIEISAPDAIYRLEAAVPEQGASFGDGEAIGPGSEVSAYSERNHQTYRGLRTSAVALMAWCVAACRELQGAGVATIGAFAVYRARTVVEDGVPPTGSATGPPDGTRISGRTAVDASASDIGGGVREISLRVDDRVVDRTLLEGDCADVDVGNADQYEYSRMQPCPGQRSAQLTLSPTDLTAGAPHVVSVVAIDAAGQDTVIWSSRLALAAPRGFFANARFFNPDLDVVGPRRLNGVQAGPAKARLSFVVGGSKHPRLVERHVIGASVRPLISGRLMTALGSPIVGARIWRAVAISDGAWQISGGPLTTSATGRVSGRLPARMPSRSVRLVYFPYSDSSENTQSAARRLKVRAATTIQAHRAGYRNGDTMRLSGRITTRPAAPRNAVYLQVIVRGRWRTFDTTRANARGQWRLSYRFTATRRLTAYRFRAVIPADDQPVSWATGYSRPLRVLVTP